MAVESCFPKKEILKVKCDRFSLVLVVYIQDSIKTIIINSSG